MTSSINHTTLTEEINSITSLVIEAKTPSTIINDKVNRVIESIQITTNDDYKKPLYNLVSWLQIRRYKSLVAKVQEETSREFIMIQGIKKKLDQWVSEASEENRAGFQRKIITFLENEKNTGLYLHDLNLSFLPKIFDSAIFSERLKSLCLKDNELTTLAIEICDLQSLEDLTMAENLISLLPTEIGRMTKLTLLNIVDNGLTKLPKEIGQLKALKYLYLGYNLLTELPEEIGELTELVQLRLEDNQLTELPAEIGECRSLDVLDISSNSLSSLPAEIGQLGKLRELYL